MPTINVYYNEEKHLPQLKQMTPPLKEYAAEELTCGDRKLDPGEVSVRLIQATGEGMLAAVELEIKAAPYKERVDKQDEICLSIRKFVLDHIEDLEDAQVWLILSELGHSME